MKGLKVGSSEITFTINEQSSVPSKSCPNLNLNRLYINRWLIANGGIETLAKEKPDATMAVHCEARKKLVVQYYGVFTCTISAVTFIDEIWIYRTNRSRKIK